MLHLGSKGTSDHSDKSTQEASDSSNQALESSSKGISKGKSSALVNFSLATIMAAKILSPTETMTTGDATAKVLGEVNSSYSQQMKTTPSINQEATSSASTDQESVEPISDTANQELSSFHEMPPPSEGDSEGSSSSSLTEETFVNQAPSENTRIGIELAENLIEGGEQHENIEAGAWLDEHKAERAETNLEQAVDMNAAEQYMTINLPPPTKIGHISSAIGTEYSNSEVNGTEGGGSEKNISKSNPSGGEVTPQTNNPSENKGTSSTSGVNNMSITTITGGEPGNQGGPAPSSSNSGGDGNGGGNG